ncbi:MAG: histidine--tRNA ligase [Candidatus Aminicenantes bacterium]|nr:histidine--tRNA ligase [Candidatus Aminicenantes bacterium]
MSKVNAPKGTGDLFSPQIEKWQYLEDKIRSYFSRFLYREIRTPVFEHSELFQRGIGSETEVVQKEMYTFADKAGRSLTLRPENTASVVRAAIEHNLLNDMFPLRFLYIGPMFRYEKPQKGRQRQFHQFGIEVFADGSPQVDAEVIYSAYNFLKEIDLRSISVEVNSVGCDVCRPGFLEQLQTAAREKKDALCVECQRKTDTNPLRIFDCKNEKCIDTSNSFPKITAHLCEECAVHFDQVKAALQILQVEYKINPRMVRGLDYYTKTTFEIISGQLGAQNAVLGGGRYDNLIKDLGGPDMVGIGFAAGMERIILHLQEVELEPRKKILVAYQNPEIQDAALGLCETLWRSGVHAYMEYSAKNLKKQFKKGDKLSANYTFILGEEEAQNNTISVKDMSSREQITIKQEELAQWLKKNI